MSLSSYALVTVADLKTHMGLEGTGEDTRLEEAINAASLYIESQTNRHFITRGAVTEYHSLYEDRHTIELAQSPIITVTSVHESTSSPRVYDATTLLTVDTEYIVVSNAERAVIRRISSSELYTWSTGYRAIKVIYSYGYANIAAIPLDLLEAAKKLAASMFKEAERGWGNITSQTDATGSTTRVGRIVTPDVQRIIDSYTNIRFDRTWEAA